MEYYKIIQNHTVVGVGYMFLRYYERVRQYCYCPFLQAQCVQDIITERIYHPDWMAAPETQGNPPEEAEVEMIDEDEYNELYEQLTDGEEIPVPIDPIPEPEPEPEPIPGPEPEPEHRMTIQEMRDKIAELTSRVLNDTRDFSAQKTYQPGDIIPDGSRVYVANNVIISGETVRPGYNCTETTIADVINMLQKKE